MANNFMHYTCYLIVLTVCIDQGDGRWKRKDKKENLQHDIEVFRKMADKVEQEIEEFYDEYSDERLTGDIGDRIRYKAVQNKLNRNSLTANDSEINGVKSQINSMLDNPTKSVPTADVHTMRKLEPNNHVSFRNDINVPRDEPKPWPKFEDILLEMGKRYDWKNDRWIKVKDRIKDSSSKKNKSEVDFHERHKFSYRIVKLNRNKSRRNVVVAVSAVR